jgi:hypothetical protein
MTILSDAEALFVSDLQPSDRPSGEQISQAIRDSIAVHKGLCGCVSDFAAEYGEHPDVAAERMRWALEIVSAGRLPIAS